MPSDGSDEDLARLVADLVRTLRELEDELEPPEPDGTPRLPTPEDFRRFTSEVAIPGLILVLETNIRALQLVQRALRIATDSDSSDASAPSRTRAQAVKLGQATLSRLDDTLTERSLRPLRSAADVFFELQSEAVGNDIRKKALVRRFAGMKSPVDDTIGFSVQQGRGLVIESRTIA